MSGPDLARLRPLDRLRLLEVLDENVELQAAIKEYRDGFWEMALRGDTHEEREAARQKVLAIEDFRFFLQHRKQLYRQEVGTEQEQ